MTTIITRDILTIEKGVIVHQVNCQGVMGAGLAKKIANKWPAVKREYESWCVQPGEDLLGTVSHTKVAESLFVVNVFGQLRYGKNQCFTNYVSLGRALRRVSGFARFFEVVSNNIYLPHGIGCGLAGGDWHVVSALIEQELPDAVICRWPDPQFTAPLPKSLVQR